MKALNRYRTGNTTILTTQVSNKAQHIYYTFTGTRQLATATADTKISTANTQVRPFEAIPGPVSLPFIGTLYLYKLGTYKIDEYHDVLRELHRKYGPIARQKIGTKTIVHVFDPDDVRTVHSVEGKMPVVPPLQEATQLYRKKRNFSLGLGNTNGEEWYRLRKAVQQMMMRPREVAHYHPLADQVAKDFVRKIGESLDPSGRLSDVQNIIAKWSMESAGMVCFDRRLGCMDINEAEADAMYRANRDIFILGGYLKFALPLFKLFPALSPTWNKFLKAEDFFYTNAVSYVHETIAKLEECRKLGTLRQDQYNFMGYLLSKEELSVNDCIIITLSLFADGLSTTAPSLAFNLYCLAKHPEVQQQVFEEIQATLKKYNGDLTPEGINECRLLKAAVKETFRLYPIGTETSRITETDLVLANYHIPKGTHVDLNQFVNFKSPNYFTDPEKYLPERWVREPSPAVDAKSKGRHPYLLIPFGHGTRMCAGRRFAEQDLYISLFRILQNFKIALENTNLDLKQKYQTLLVPQQDFTLRLTPR